MSWEMELNDDMLEELYEWIDGVPLSRPKKRIERDFADGCLIAEIVRHFLPNVIEMHNFTPAHNLQQKLANWGLLNSKVFSRFGLNVPLNITQHICNCKPGYVEVLLYNLRYKIEEKLHESGNKPSPRAASMIHNMSSSRYKGSSTKTGGPGAVPTEIRLQYEEKVQENLEQQEQIKILEAKVRRLEHLLQLKETRIDDLTNRLDRFRPTAITSHSPSLQAEPSKISTKTTSTNKSTTLTSKTSLTKNSVSVS